MAEPTTQAAQTDTKPTTQEPAGAKAGGGDPTSAPSATKAQEPAAKPDAPTPEELAEYRKWKDAQKTEAEKHAEAIRKANEATAKEAERATAAELKVTALSKGASAEALDDIIALAKTKITDKVTAEQAIDEILAKYPVFSAAQARAKTTGTFTRNNGPDTGTDESKIRRAMGLPEKK